MIVAEGPRLLQEAIRGSWTIEQVLVADTYRSGLTDLLDAVRADVIEVTERAFASTAATQTHQGVITLLRPRTWSWSDFRRAKSLTMVLDRIQDPGNAGTLIRSAEAFGATGVILLQDSVRLSNGKLLRAAAGSAFRIPLLENVSSEELLREFRNPEVGLYALSATAPRELFEIDLTAEIAFVLGSEGSGISPLLEFVAEGVRIPVGIVESLNVGVAGSIAVYEAARQRRATR